MLKSILYDLNEIDDYDVYYLLNDNLEIDGIENCNLINLNNNLYAWLKSYSKDYDYCLFIAPEDDLIQYKITKILENNNVQIIGSNSKASYICSSKTRTYDKVSDKITKIPTIKSRVDNINYNKIKDILSKNEVVIKPDDKTSSDFIYHVTNIEDFKKIMKIYSDNSLKEVLIQKYISGNPVSISIIYNDNYINYISLNSQEISEKEKNIIYKGCKTPIKHPLKEKIIRTSKIILENIPGLKGFIGIDYIIHENEIYFVEINSRITTPFIILHQISENNLTKTLINLILNNKKSPIKLTDNGKFYKNYK